MPAALASALVLLACDAATPSQRADAGASAEVVATPTRASAEVAASQAVAAPPAKAGTGADAGAPPSPAADAPPVAVADEAAAADEPAAERPRLGAFVSARTTVAYAAPSWGSPIRGRIDPGNPFWALTRVDGEGCEEGGWVQVEQGGYVCLRHAEAADDAPATLPVLPEGSILPFVYAKPRQDRRGKLEAPVPRYRSYRHLLRKTGQLDELVGNRQYAFAEVIRRASVGHIYVDLEGRAVPGRDLQVQKPSELVGRELAEEPAAAGLTPAWSVSLPAILMDGPGTRRSKEVGKIDYHTRFDVDPEPLGRPGSIWYRVPGAGKEGADAFVEASQIRLWVPGPPRPEGVGDDERWLDVDVDQQMLALMVGDRPVYLTLVSTGTGKHPTPRGVFRIRNKLALGKMENKPDDPDSYYVEEVPWVLYFYKRFAFHATYWHRSLGRRRSHGCINLAPRDAARVFELTSPALPEGWTSVYEHEGEVGTVVRVRKGDDPLPDRRRPLGEEDEDDGADEPPEEGAGEDEGAEDEGGP